MRNPSLQAHIAALERRIGTLEKQMEVLVSSKHVNEAGEVKDSSILTPEETMAMYMQLGNGSQDSRKNQNKVITLPSGKVIHKDEAGVVNCYPTWANMQAALKRQEESQQSDVQHNSVPSNSQRNATATSSSWQATSNQQSHAWDANAWCDRRSGQNWNQ